MDGNCLRLLLVAAAAAASAVGEMGGYHPIALFLEGV